MGRAADNALTVERKSSRAGDPSSEFLNPNSTKIIRLPVFA